MNNTTLNLKLNVFKGSLDILIALIHEHKMDILNLDIAQLAEQYLIYIQQNINNITIDAACEYLSMSTYLIELKSKKILPSENLVDGQNNFEYERDKLIKRIIEYNEYKKAANKLIVKQDQRLMMYAKPASDLDEYVNDEVIKAKLPESIDSNKLFKAMEVAIEKWKFNLFTQTKILVQELSVDDVKKDIINFINKPKFKEASFSDFLSSIDPLKISEQYIVTCFLALLELVKYQKIILTQNNKDSEIYFVRNKIKSAMQEMIEF